GRFSSRRTGNGFQISNILKNTNPNSKYFQFTRLKAEKIAKVDRSMCECRFGSAMGVSGSNRVKCCPATSSITTNCGSLIPAYAAALVELHTPIAPRITNSTAALKIGNHSIVL